MLWKEVDINPEGRYVLLLLQDEGGGRYVRVQLVEGDEVVGSCGEALRTAEIPSAMIGTSDIIDISESVPLANGEYFILDAHNVWFTREEVFDIHEGRPVRWVGGVAPKLAPK
ncbi:hypothetical protein [Stenotrophomonas sp.]|uniref:hypothetical protein n=1 Tax=Stenotrophomonas sp. TaxID=69392 RepID=UPI00289D1EB3|nr:hypothetical protein [Stenotrophomonas sp.]